MQSTTHSLFFSLLKVVAHISLLSFSPSSFFLLLFIPPSLLLLLPRSFNHFLLSFLFIYYLRGVKADAEPHVRRALERQGHARRLNLDVDGDQGRRRALQARAVTAAAHGTSSLVEEHRHLAGGRDAQRAAGGQRGVAAHTLGHVQAARDVHRRSRYFIIFWFV